MFDVTWEQFSTDSILVLLVYLESIYFYFLPLRELFFLILRSRIMEGKRCLRVVCMSYQPDGLASLRRYECCEVAGWPPSLLPLPLFSPQVAGVVCFLLSPAASYVTSSTIRVDGGQSVYRSNFIAPGKGITVATHGMVVM